MLRREPGRAAFVVDRFELDEPQQVTGMLDAVTDVDGAVARPSSAEWPDRNRALFRATARFIAARPPALEPQARIY